MPSGKAWALTMDISGTVVVGHKYLSYSEVRWSIGALPTDRQFTGQRREASLGLYDYKARYYDPYLDRWIQPDTIIPDPAEPQNLNRYAYVLGNPIKYQDPGGHCAEGGPLGGPCIDGGPGGNRGYFRDPIKIPPPPQTHRTGEPGSEPIWEYGAEKLTLTGALLDTAAWNLTVLV